MSTSGLLSVLELEFHVVVVTARVIMVAVCIRCDNRYACTRMGERCVNGQSNVGIGKVVRWDKRQGGVTVRVCSRMK